MKYEDFQDWHKDGVCPVCNSNDVDFFGDCTTGEGCIYSCRCNDCGTEFQEDYELMFMGHFNIKPKEK